MIGTADSWAGGQGIQGIICNFTFHHQQPAIRHPKTIKKQKTKKKLEKHKK
ncbi:hypothetical protein PRVXT_000507 [Proteinivorax tanatarense]|uniref:Uncharacterized protein n=1 Tax=Proteinivorax tanatarense TaxID=1260629 RepID=A0AAU7VNQ7_9FIRM